MPTHERHTELARGTGVRRPGTPRPISGHPGLPFDVSAAYCPFSFYPVEPSDVPCQSSLRLSLFGVERLRIATPRTPPQVAPCGCGGRCNPARRPTRLPSRQAAPEASPSYDGHPRHVPDTTPPTSARLPPERPAPLMVESPSSARIRLGIRFSDNGNWHQRPQSPQYQSGYRVTANLGKARELSRRLQAEMGRSSSEMTQTQRTSLLEPNLSEGSPGQLAAERSGLSNVSLASEAWDWTAPHPQVTGAGFDSPSLAEGKPRARSSRAPGMMPPPAPRLPYASLPVCSDNGEASSTDESDDDDLQVVGCDAESVYVPRKIFAEHR